MGPMMPIGPMGGSNGVGDASAWMVLPVIVFLLGVAAFLLMLSGATLAYNGAKRSGEERAARRPGNDTVGRRLRELGEKFRKLRRRDSD